MMQKLLGSAVLSSISWSSSWLSPPRLLDGVSVLEVVAVVDAVAESCELSTLASARTLTTPRDDDDAAALRRRPHPSAPPTPTPIPNPP